MVNQRIVSAVLCGLVGGEDAPKKFEFVPVGVCVPKGGQTVDEIEEKCIADGIAVNNQDFVYRKTNDITLRTPTFCKAAADTQKLASVAWYNKTGGDSETYQMPPRSLLVAGIPAATGGDISCEVKVWLKSVDTNATAPCAIDTTKGDTAVNITSVLTPGNKSTWELIFGSGASVPTVSDPAKAVKNLLFDYTACDAKKATATYYTRHVFEFKQTGGDGVSPILANYGFVLGGALVLALAANL